MGGRCTPPPPLPTLIYDTQRAIREAAKKVNFLLARPLRPYLVTFLSIASIIHSLDKIYQENNLFIQITDLAELKTNISRSQK